MYFSAFSILQCLLCAAAIQVGGLGKKSINGQHAKLIYAKFNGDLIFIKWNLVLFYQP